MDRVRILTLLREHEAELRAEGVDGLSVFGSIARGHETDPSDVDIVVRLSPQAAEGGFVYFGRLDSLARRLGEILGRPVDLVPEPVRKERLRRQIEKDAAIAF